MSVQTREAYAFLNSCDGVKNFIAELPSISSLWVLYQADYSELSFKDWLIKLTPKKAKELKEGVLGITMGQELDMEDGECISIR